MSAGIPDKEEMDRGNWITFKGGETQIAFCVSCVHTIIHLWSRMEEQIHSESICVSSYRSTWLFIQQAYLDIYSMLGSILGA